MSDTTDATPAYTGDERVELQHADRTVINNRMAVLAEYPTPSLKERGELAALVRLTAQGHVTVAEVWDILCELRYIARTVTVQMASEENTREWLQPLLNSVHVIWANLQSVVRDVQPSSPRGRPFDSESGDYDVWQQERQDRLMAWVRDFMELLDQAMMGDQVYPFDVADVLPSWVTREVEHRHDVLWHASPYAAGAALVECPFRDGQVYGYDNGPALLETLAYDVLQAVGQCQGVDLDNPELPKALGRLNLRWCMLKGFVLQMLQSPHVGAGLMAQVAKAQELHEPVSTALTVGLNVLKDIDVVHEPKWQSHGGEVDQAIATTPTDELLTQFREAITRNLEFLEHLDRLR